MKENALYEVVGEKEVPQNAISSKMNSSSSKTRKPGRNAPIHCDALRSSIRKRRRS
jgi:hypothetical protein